jgi:hypothetical protein
MGKKLERELKEGYIIMAKEDIEAAEANLGATEEVLRCQHADKEK